MRGLKKTAKEALFLPLLISEYMGGLIKFKESPQKVPNYIVGAWEHRNLDNWIHIQTDTFPALWGEEPLSQAAGPPWRERQSDKAIAAKTGSQPVGQRQAQRDNDTSVIRGPATMKAGRWNSYGAASEQPSVWIQRILSFPQWLSGSFGHCLLQYRRYRVLCRKEAWFLYNIKDIVSILLHKMAFENI